MRRRQCVPAEGLHQGQDRRGGKGDHPLLEHALAVEQPETILVRVWREDSDQRIGLAITDTGRGSIDSAGPDLADNHTVGEASVPLVTVSVTNVPRSGSKIKHIVGLLRRDEGATPIELIEATGWMAHTMRAALTGLRKKGHQIERSKRDETTCYRIIAAA